MTETVEASPPSLAELKTQIAKGDPAKWGADSRNPVETDKGFIKWMTGDSAIKRLFGRMSRPFRRPSVKA